MTEQQSSFNFQIEWAKERLAEMDAALASLERGARGAQAAARAKADQALTELRKRRDEYQHAMTKGFEAGTTAWAGDKAHLESQWNRFSAELSKNVDALGKQISVQQSMFRDLAAAQRKAWHDAGDELLTAMKDFAAERRAGIEGAVQKMKVDASQSEAQLQKLMGVGNESWKALNAALSQSRAAFDHALEAAGDAFKHATHQGRGNKAENPPAQ